MLRILLIALAVYFAYRLIFHLIIPVYRTTRQVKKGFREMQEKMNAQYQQQQQAQPQPKETQQKTAPKGDYIDFEEVK